MPRVSIFILFSMVTIISSCCTKSHEPKKVEQIPPSTADYAWFQYPTGDRIFKNQSGNFDTIVAHRDDIVHYQGFQKEQEMWYSDCKTYYSHGILSGSFGLKTDSNTILLATLDGAGVSRCNLQLKLGYYFSSTWNLPSRDTALTIDNISYNDVYVIDSVIRNGMPSIYLHKAYYSRSKGFVKYITPDNDVWELLN